MTDAFIGVVSHVGSRFAVSQTERGLAQQLQSALTADGLEARVVVNTENLHDSAALPVTRAMERASLAAQLRIDRTWRRYLGARRGPVWWAIHAVRWVRFGVGSLRPRDSATVTRLLNIELSHLV